MQVMRVTRGAKDLKSTHSNHRSVGYVQLVKLGDQW